MRGLDLRHWHDDSKAILASYGLEQGRFQTLREPYRYLVVVCPYAECIEDEIAVECDSEPVHLSLIHI